MKAWVVISSTEWATHWGTQHQAAWRLPGRVLFLELPASPLSGFTGLRPGAFRRQLRLWRRGLRPGGREGLWAAMPPPLLPLRYHRATNRINQALLARFARGLLARLDLGRPAVLTFQADSGALVRALPAAAAAYWCTDEWAAAGRWWQPAAAVRRREAELARACQVLAAVSLGLQERLAAGGRPVLLLRNAVDLELFGPPAAPLPELAGLKRPVVGFAGILTRDSFDGPLVAALAARFPAATFLIAGRVEGRGVDLAGLAGAGNVVRLPFQPRERLPGLVAAMDVCLIPWAETPWVERAFSLKLFEYLAQGKPVVAAATREYEPYAGLVHLARGVEGFAAALGAALAESGPELPARRRALAAENGWDRRVAELVAAVTAAAGGERG